MSEFGAILTSQGDWVIVSMEDWELVNRHKWHTHRAGGRQKYHAHPYATASIKRKSTRMHRLLTNAPEGMIVDHINRDSLDNRRENLRVTTNAVNMINSKDRDRDLPRHIIVGHYGFRVEIKRGKKMVVRRRFKTLEEAILFRDGYLACERQFIPVAK